MEQNNNYSFSFNPNEKKEAILSDEGGKSKLTIEGNDAPLNLPSGNVTLVNRPKVKTKKLVMQDIGPKSNGFAGVATLAGIIAVAGALIAFLALKY